MTDRRVPTHLIVLAGVSASAYAVVLAGVTGLQSTADARLIAQRRPAVEATEAAVRQHETLERAVDDAAERYAALADRYVQAGGDLGSVEAAIDALASRAAALTESAGKLRVTPFALPRVTRSVPRSAAPPTTHATTKASG